jgi:hypothetical protein
MLEFWLSNSSFHRCLWTKQNWRSLTECQLANTRSDWARVGWDSALTGKHIERFRCLFITLILTNFFLQYLQGGHQFFVSDSRLEFIGAQ